MANLSDTKTWPKGCGIYQIRCTVSGGCYVGRAVDFYRRMHHHRKDRAKKTSFLYAAMRKYDLSAFEITVLEYCEREALMERERFWIEQNNPRYNSVRCGTNGAVFFSQDYREKLSAARRGNKNRLGIPHTDEVKARISNTLRGNQWNVGKKASESTRAKQSAAHKGSVLNLTEAARKARAERCRQNMHNAAAREKFKETIRAKGTQGSHLHTPEMKKKRADNQRTAEARQRKAARSAEVYALLPEDTKKRMMIALEAGGKKRWAMHAERKQAEKDSLI